MSFGQYQTVTVFLFWIFGIDVHLLKIQISKNICRRQRAARMSGRCTMYRCHDPFSDLYGSLFQFLICHIFLLRYDQSPNTAR